MWVSLMVHAGVLVSAMGLSGKAVEQLRKESEARKRLEVSEEEKNKKAEDILSAAGRRYKIDVGHQILLALSQSGCREAVLATFRSRYLSLSMRFHFRSPLRRDVDGGVKITQDAVLEALGLNDNRIVELHLFKSLDGTLPHVEILLSPSSGTPATAGRA